MNFRLYFYFMLPILVFITPSDWHGIKIPLLNKLQFYVTKYVYKENHHRTAVVFFLYKSLNFF
jgi:hypothetical protein